MTAYDDILAERDRQDAKWGEQNHPDGTGPNTLPLMDTWIHIPEDDMRGLEDYTARLLAFAATQATNAAARGHRSEPVTWRDILLEEVTEAFAEEDLDRLRTELIQVAAVAAQWAEAIDRRRT